MEIFRTLFFTIIAPMIWLAFFAVAFSSSALAIAEAWKKKDKKKLYLNTWIMMVGIYLLLFSR